jgi:hypothetical protein
VFFPRKRQKESFYLYLIIAQRKLSYPFSTQALHIGRKISLKVHYYVQFIFIEINALFFYSIKSKYDEKIFLCMSSYYKKKLRYKMHKSNNILVLLM